MNSTFAQYISHRLAGTVAVSEVERDLVIAADSLGARGAVAMVYLRDKHLETYHCEIIDACARPRVSVSRIGDDKPHRLRELLGDSAEIRRQRDSLFGTDRSGRMLYDPYFDTFRCMEGLLDQLDLMVADADCTEASMTLVNYGDYADAAVRYAFERRCGRVVELPDSRNVTVDTRGRIELQSSLMNHSTGVRFPMQSVKGLVLNRDDVFVPLDRVTLDSPFFDAVTWRDILGPMAESGSTDVVIADTHCRMARVVPGIDSYGNFWITVSDSIAPSSKHLSLVYGPGRDVAGQKLTKPVDRPDRLRPPRPSNPRPQPIVRGNNIQVTRTPAKSREPFIFDGREVDLDAISARMESMSDKEVRSTIRLFDSILVKLASVDRIVTDTNVWITADRNGEIKYRDVLEHLRKLLKKAGKKGRFELGKDAYDEIVRLSGQKCAAASVSKVFVMKYLNDDILRIPDISLRHNPKAYADIPIGQRVLEMYGRGESFAIINDDSDAVVRWLASMREMEERGETPGGNPFPPNMLIRNLHFMYRLRGKLLRRQAGQSEPNPIQTSTPTE